MIKDTANRCVTVMQQKLGCRKLKGREVERNIVKKSNSAPWHDAINPAGSRVDDVPNIMCLEHNMSNQ